MSKYNIGKRPLSLLLDWGELTITRYLKGMPPKKEYLDGFEESVLTILSYLMTSYKKITRS